MNLRQQQEEYEFKHLNERATKSRNTLGRAEKEDPCIIRTEFQRDKDRIIHCKAFRRLKHKTQMFISPEGDHFRTRMTHSLEVSQIARTIARALRLNEDLTEAIAMAHDLGHAPFGHTGEKVLNRLLSKGFHHNLQSVRIVTIIENLNLTKETLDGIQNHTGSSKPMTLEGQIVKIADRIAYLNHDIDDSIRAGLLSIEDIPEDITKALGTRSSERITTMVCSMVRASSGSEEIKLDEEIQEATDNLRNWMFENIYTASEESLKAERVIEELFKYYQNNTHLLADIHNQADETEITIADHIAGMTDRYALNLFKKTFLPQPTSTEYE
ncbi:MAG: deoxyguanosinetriphosphate triphosphohydrolase [Vampirovibrionia bacterium]